MQESNFARKIGTASGIGQLMEDLASALSPRTDVLMLGGGNPAHIPAVEQALRKSVERILSQDGLLEHTLGDYSPSGGDARFIDALCRLLNDRFNWGIEPPNVALTNGSQSAFFILFNIFAGTFDNGTRKKILLPLVPEYIGYADVGLSNDMFVAAMPGISHIDEHIFKYHVDFDNLRLGDDIGALCVSRPTNPTSNVLTDAEIARLAELARRKNIPLIIDSAYGSPFPDIVFTQASPLWTPQTIVCMSLSKFGLPGARTGIVIANEKIIQTVSRANAVMSLAPGSIGAALTAELVRTGEILRLSSQIIRPFYRKKAQTALQILQHQLDGLDYHVHRPEGAFFLWLWLRGLSITSAELYARLKKHRVLVVPGHYFFPGLTAEWPHKHQCIRISYAPDDSIVEQGLKIIGDEVRSAYAS